MKLSDLNSDLNVLEAHATAPDGTKHHFCLAWPRNSAGDLPCSAVWQWKLDGIISDKAAAQLMHAVLEQGKAQWLEG
jgi:hypothetical protein